MTTALTDLEPQLVWSYFDQILRIPRCSGNEAAIRQHLVELAAARGWQSRVDRVGNVVIAIPASAGYESAPGIVFQGHLDMVCEKNNDVDHDFATTGIDAYVEGDNVKARGTSLGADNGIGLAMSLAAADATKFHGPIEILATVEEETGLTGATGLDVSMINGRILLNLDSEEEGEFCVGCAGGGDQAGYFRPNRSEAPADSARFELSVGGLLGGHSGIDIALGRGNAIVILVRLLRDLDEAGLLLGLETLSGGSKHNAIPREARAVVRIPAGSADALANRIAGFHDAEAKKLSDVDPGLTVRATPADGEAPVVLAADLRPVIDTVLDVPHGVVAMSADIPGLVETSNNVAIITDDGQRIRLYTSARSSVATELEALRDRICNRMEQAGAAIERDEAYPGWQPNLASPLLAHCQEVFTKLRGKAAPVGAVHAGLECGIIGEQVEGMDMISFGPDIHHPHSPDEYVTVSSVQHTFEFVVALVEDLAGQR